ncbi:HAMP domain-containing histidine kinase [Schinkia azotoformans]|uniref:HAMP domain-containing histidine kinase n=1 Tax=Schinkia azotoformans TaxID=1454 RepID=UPI002E1AA809|nr:HAMP domain-containing histidine kinase [Schinkia azotoformans]
MKLFIRDQLPFIFVYFMQIGIITGVYWLDGYENLKISLYAALLSIILLVFYLFIRYRTHRFFYKRLETPLASLDEFPEKVEKTPLSKSLHQLLTSQFRFYKTDIHRYKYKLEGHIQFINQWVHQMKTPLSVIHLLIQDEDDSRFTIIGDELDKLKKGLEMALYTARLDSFEHDFYVESLDLEAIVRSVTSDQKRLFIRKRVFPSIHFDEKITVASDEKWLSFVLTQIITNAIKYTIHENQKIHFRGYKQNNQVILEIRDEGVGIPKSDLPRIFAPYFTGENGRNFQESTGMGLYLTKQICDKLGINIDIESAPNEGTTVKLYFNSYKVVS